MEEQKNTEHNTSETTSNKPKRIKTRPMRRKYERVNKEVVKKPKKRGRKPNPNKTEFKVIITMNGNMYKKISTRWVRSRALDDYHDVIKESKLVEFPSKIKGSRKEPFIVANFEVKIVRRLLKDEVLEDNNLLFKDDWKIIRSEPIDLEEDFYVYGFHPNHERKTIQEIKQYLLKYIEFNRELGYYGNKVVLFNDEEFDMIIAKTPNDAERLCKKIYNYVNKPELMFYYGKYEQETAGFIREVINSYTGWDENKIRKTRLK